MYTVTIKTVLKAVLTFSNTKVLSNEQDNKIELKMLSVKDGVHARSNFLSDLNTGASKNPFSECSVTPSYLQQ
jgi:hypothetical protein